MAVWLKFRNPATKEAIPSWMSLQADSLTITKIGVVMWGADGERKFFYPHEQVHAVVHQNTKWTHVQKELPIKDEAPFIWDTWEVTVSENGMGLLT